MCKYCESRDFTRINDTGNYSGIEISLNNQGILEVRYSSNLTNGFDSQDTVSIKYCPFCGRKFK